MFGDMEEYFSTCSWMNDIYDEKKWIFFMNVGNNFFLWKIEQKKQGENNISWFISKHLTHEMFKSHFKSYFIFH
jgi:hypothetical protein